MTIWEKDCYWWIAKCRCTSDIIIPNGMELTLGHITDGFAMVEKADTKVAAIVAHPSSIERLVTFLGQIVKTEFNTGCLFELFGSPLIVNLDMPIDSWVFVPKDSTRCSAVWLRFESPITSLAISQ